MTFIDRVVAVTALTVLMGCTKADDAKVNRTEPTNSTSSPDSPRLTSEEVVRIASQVAEREGLRLSEYKAPDAHFEYTRQDRSWTVFYEGKIAKPGNHFSVQVDDQSGKAEVLRGE